MAVKKERTSFSVSTNLKSGLVAVGRLPEVAEGQAFYDTVSADLQLAVKQADDGSFRTINITGATVSFDFIDPTDAMLVRFWTERELNVLIGQTPGITNNSGTLDGTKWNWAIPYNGVTYTANDTSKPDAMAKCFIKVLTAIGQGLRQA